jgi:hypothetical protein
VFMRNPQVRGVEEQLVNLINTLLDWEREA